MASYVTGWMRLAGQLMGDRMPDKYVEQSPGPGEYDLPTVQEQRGTQVMSNTAGRDEKMRFISAFHAQSVLQVRCDSSQQHPAISQCDLARVAGV